MESYLFNQKRKVFTCKTPMNTFKLDYSNGAPVQITTNVTKNTKWLDIFTGKYTYANPNGTPENVYFGGEKYTYVDYNFALKHKYEFFTIPKRLLSFSNN